VQVASASRKCKVRSNGKIIWEGMGIKFDCISTSMEGQQRASLTGGLLHQSNTNLMKHFKASCPPSLVPYNGDLSKSKKNEDSDFPIRKQT
jgi:hypothetical protein